MDQSSTQSHCNDEDRTEQRRLDVLKGFAYLESFDEILAWAEDDVDALQRSNTPLLRRAQPGGKHGAKVMLIHDYMGGYNEYESCQGLAVPEEQYSCDYLQFVETFVYFSHRLVAIPPPAWTNTCHRNGVTVLGTFIVEPGSTDVECILQQDELGSFWVARKLANMAKCSGFDGWLINIETSFSLLSWSAAKLEGFLRQLRAELGVEGKVVWYDALTTLNFVWYQNTLNYMNLQFALAAGSMLTNYAWDPDLAQSGKIRASKSGMGLENVYFGIDVWAQNYQKDSKHKRITWPKAFGGGTGTGLGVQVLRELGLNVGIFAPGWSYEHFSRQNSAVESAVWRGTPLPKDLPCECNPQRPHDTAPYQQHGLIEYAKAFPAGSATFFHSTFERAFSRTRDGVIHAHVGSQNVQPFETETVSSTARLQAKVHDRPSRCVLSMTSLAQTSRSCSRIQLAKTRVAAHEPLKLTMKYRILQCIHQNLQIQADFADSKGQRYSRHESLVVANGSLARLEWTLDISAVEDSRAAQEVNPVFLESLFICHDSDQSSLPPSREKSDILEIFSITVMAKSARERKCEISDIRLEKRGAGKSRHSRLVWTLDSNSEQKYDDGVMPYSPLTGPCAYFEVYVHGEALGRAYALEFVLPSTEKVEEDKSRLVRIIGVGFDDEILCEAAHNVTDSEDDGGEEEEWVLVEKSTFVESSE
ncbi:hypothetical protein BST61_g101 [Cercospora zeina]